MSVKKYKLEIAVFCASASVMIFELVGSRLLGPYFGTSLPVWTILIGVILASMSLGYYYGGRLADIKPSVAELSSLFLGSAISIIYVVLGNGAILTFLQSMNNSVELGSLLGAILLFSPASVFLGMISPYVTKMKVVEENHIGTTVGNISAISTVGSIVGTFFAGLYLIPNFGTTVVLILLSAGLLLITFSLSLSMLIQYWKLLGILVLLMVGNQLSVRVQNEMKGIIDVDTAYNRIWIRTTTNIQQKNVRTMGINNENHSSMYIGSTDLVNEYTKYYHLAQTFFPGFKSTLMLGGAGYSFPKNFLETYPLATMDVVEIDPGVTALARKYFELKDSPRLTIYHEDGRVYLNRNVKKYDVIFGDAFSSRYSLPYQLTTQEAVRKIYGSLEQDGVVILNIISTIEGEGGLFLRAEVKTYKSVFPYVEIYPVTEPSNGATVQNIILVAAKKPIVTAIPNNQLSEEYLSHRWSSTIFTDDVPIITDDYAPVDYYVSKALN